MRLDDIEHYVALPASLQLEPVPPDLPSDLARFFGVWGGTWEDDWRTMLIVEKIDATGKARVVYALAECSEYGAEATWTRMDASIDAAGLSIRWPWATVKFVIDGERLKSRYATQDGHTTLGALARIEARSVTSPHRLVEAAEPGDRVVLPHKTLMTPGGTPVQLEARLFRPKTNHKAPLAVFNHGSAIGRHNYASYSCAIVADWLTQQGYVVLVPMRRGRGRSGGALGEHIYGHSNDGTIIDIASGIDAAVEDLQSAIAFGQALPFVELGPVLLVGQSRGGFLSVVYAGRYPKDAAGVINFVGGWRGGPTEVLNTPYCAEAGRASAGHAPQLWLYGEGDSYYGEPHIRTNFKAFIAAGGSGQLEVFTKPPGIGHHVLRYPDIWQPIAADYLSRLKPTKP